MTLLEKRMLEKKTSTFLLDEDIRSVFSQFDRDGNGYLGASDLAAVYRSLGEHLDDDLVSSPRSLIHTSLRRAWSMPRRVQWVCNPYFKHPEHGCSDGVPQIDELIREADKDGDGQIGAYHPPHPGGEVTRQAILACILTVQLKGSADTSDRAVRWQRTLSS